MSDDNKIVNLIPNKEKEPAEQWTLLMKYYFKKTETLQLAGQSSGYRSKIKAIEAGTSWIESSGEVPDMMRIIEVIQGALR